MARSGHTRLDQDLLLKIAGKVNKSKKYVREQVSKRASRLSVCSEAVLILWAKELGIGTATAQRRLEPHMQEQVRQALPIVFVDSAQNRSSKTRPGKAPTGSRNPTGLAIDYLLSDGDLKSRCKDLLKGRRHFDRVLREATTVLESRIKSLAAITSRMDPAALVSKAINPNPAKAILVLSNDKSQQEGFHGICKGIVLAFRNRAHHELDDKITQQDALKFCAFVDMLLGLLAKAQKIDQG